MKNRWMIKKNVDHRDINKLMYGPSKVEMLLPKASTVKSILKVTCVGMMGLLAVIIISLLLF